MGVGCVICTEEFSAWQHSDKMSVVIKSCGHVFHDSCIKLWLKNSRTCPVCRQTTYDSPSYIGRVHLQRLSLDNTAVNNLLDESVEQKKKLEELEQKLKEKDAKLKTKDAELKKKENENKELNGKLHGICEYLNKISDGVKSIKCILHNPPVVEIKDDDHPITSSRAVINPRPSIIRSNRAPIPSSTAVSSRLNSSNRVVPAIGRVVSSRGVTISKRN